MKLCKICNEPQIGGYIICPDCVERIGGMQAELARVRAERDAAVADLHHNDACTVCVGPSVPEAECDCECDGCELDCRCRDCRNESKWQWRGTGRADIEVAISAHDEKRMNELYREEALFYMRGIPLSRLEEICQAERENRCVVLPCGDEIEELDLSIRAYNCLKRAGYDTISKLMRASNADLQQVRNLGSKRFEEVRDKIAALKGAEHE